VNALKFLRPAFGALALSEITTEAVENYLGIDFSLSGPIPRQTCELNTDHR